LRSELRRMIRALAIRTASVRGDRFSGSGVFVSAAAVGIMRNGVGTLEPCATGCMFIGPVDVDLRLGIMDNAQMQSSFDALNEAPPPRTACADLADFVRLR
jgi:hypothetical protein